VDLFPKSRNTVCPAPRIPGDRSFRAKDRVRQRADETEVTLDKPRGLIETRATCVTSDTTANAETARTGKKQHRFRCLSRRVRRVRALGSRVGGGRLHRLRKKNRGSVGEARSRKNCVGFPIGRRKAEKGAAGFASRPFGTSQASGRRTTPVLACLSISHPKWPHSWHTPPVIPCVRARLTRACPRTRIAGVLPSAPARWDRQEWRRMTRTARGTAPSQEAVSCPGTKPRTC
jgi:hypothetical protein